MSERPSVKLSEVVASCLVLKEIRIWVAEIGVIKGGVRMSLALTRDSVLERIISMTLGITVSAEKITTTGMMTAKADLRGMPQSL